MTYAEAIAAYEAANVEWAEACRVFDVATKAFRSAPVADYAAFGEAQKIFAAAKDKINAAQDAIPEEPAAAIEAETDDQSAFDF